MVYNLALGSSLDGPIAVLVAHTYRRNKHCTISLENRDATSNFYEEQRSYSLEGADVPHFGPYILFAFSMCQVNILL